MFIPAVIIPFLIAGCAPPPLANQENSGTTVICFGDSLTAGSGAGPGEDYPAFIRSRTSRPVVNAGVIGETTRDAMRRVDQDVLSQDPYLVIVEFGANDFFKQIPREETFRNLDQIVARIQQAGAMVVIAEVRTGLIKDEYFQGFRDIAVKRRALFLPDIMKGIIFNNDLMSDTIHPNGSGYAVMAERIYKKVRIFLEEG